MLMSSDFIGHFCDTFCVQKLERDEHLSRQISSLGFHESNALSYDAVVYRRMYLWPIDGACVTLCS